MTALLSKINHITLGGLLDKLLYGVPLTSKQLTLASETIYYFFWDNGAGYLISDLILKTRYKSMDMTDENKIESWLEDRTGYRLNSNDMDNLRFRILELYRS